MADNEYKVIISGEDFSDVIRLDNGYKFTVSSFSAESSTGQLTNGNMRVPVLGERVQLVFNAPEYITKERLYQLVAALKMGTKGQREVTITYDDPLFGKMSHSFYCTNVPWIKEKLPNYPHHYASGVQIQLTSTRFVGKSVKTDTPKIPPVPTNDNEYKFIIGSEDFSDIIDIKGYQGQIIDQSLESKTGLRLNGMFDLPIIGSRTQLNIKAIEYMEVGRFRQLGKALGFGKTGERSHKVTYEDMVMGQTTQTFYCTQISGYREKLPNYPYHYMKDVTFQQAMKQFF